MLSVGRGALSKGQAIGACAVNTTIANGHSATLCHSEWPGCIAQRFALLRIRFAQGSLRDSVALTLKRQCGRTPQARRAAPFELLVHCRATESTPLLARQRGGAEAAGEDSPGR